MLFLPVSFPSPCSWLSQPQTTMEWLTACTFLALFSSSYRLSNVPFCLSFCVFFRLMLYPGKPYCGLNHNCSADDTYYFKYEIVPPNEKAAQRFQFLPFGSPPYEASAFSCNLTMEYGHPHHIVLIYLYRLRHSGYDFTKLSHTNSNSYFVHVGVLSARTVSDSAYLLRHWFCTVKGITPFKFSKIVLSSEISFYFRCRDFRTVC